MATTKSITIHVDDHEVQIELGPAKKMDGLRRAEMMLQASQSEMPELKKQVAFFLYPTCICAVKAPPEITNMSFEDFINKVDEADIDAWNNAAYEVNPQWRAAMQMLGSMSQQDAEKKITTPLSGSTPPMEPKRTIRSRHLKK